MKGLFLLLAAVPLCGQWRTGYLDGQWYDAPIASLPLDVYTHIIHACVKPASAGLPVTLDTTTSHIDRDAPALIAAAHAKGAQILLGICGSGASLDAASDPAHLASFIAALQAVQATYGYDGFDVDWEGWPRANYTTFVFALRAAIGSRAPLTAFLGPVSSGAPIAAAVDQLNISCYDRLDYTGHRVWPNAALYDSFQPSNRYSNCANYAAAFVAAGIPPGKIGIGIPFYGYKYAGGLDADGSGPAFFNQRMVTPFTEVRQTWFRNIPRIGTVQDQLRDDPEGRVPYLVMGDGASSVLYTYDDPASVAGKLAFAKSNGFGGVSVWMIGMDYFPGGSTPGAQFPLSEALRIAASGCTYVCPSQ